MSHFIRCSGSSGPSTQVYSTPSVTPLFDVVVSHDFHYISQPHHTDRNRQHTTNTPDRTQLRDSSPIRRQAGAQKRLMRTRKPVLFAAQESPDDLSDSGGGIRKRPDFGMTRSMIRDWNDLSDWAGQVFSIPIPSFVVWWQNW